MTERAKRLARYLENRGWTVFDEKYVCSNKSCLMTTGHGKFCYICGWPLKLDTQNERNAIGELESAIKFALRKKK